MVDAERDASQRRYLVQLRDGHQADLSLIEQWQLDTGNWG